MSGGGDSVALLHLAADWAKTHGRPLLALTVDHGLNPDSADWTRRAGAAARALGADWRALPWTGDKPASGLPAAARAARHRLLADAARQAGASVILLAHTAGDVAEGELMRAEGAALGQLRDWSPSPVWPEGRGLMLLRPLLDARRADLRDWLRSRGADWIEDPANADPRFARPRARQALSEGAVAPAPRTQAEGRAGGVLGVRDDIIHIARDISARAFSAALVCAGGGERPPRGDRLEGLRARLRDGEDFTAALSGARIEARGAELSVLREPGEFRRTGLSPLPLPPGRTVVWDGRWSLTVDQPGWSVAPAAGRMALLSDADRTILRALPVAARAGRPVLIRNGPGAPVLAGASVKAHALIEARLARALDGMTHERDLDANAHGAPPRKHLFS
ncbi:MAG: tRNA lysidine(34) synthetase TilS, partial [Brevundimonas sp.]